MGRERTFVSKDSSAIYPMTADCTGRRLPDREGFPTPVAFYTSRHFPPIRMGGDTNLDGSPDQTGEYEVRVMDNDHNTYQQVMDITMLALDLTEEQAYAVAWEVDHKGSCVVAIGPRDEAESVASIIRTIGIEVQVNLVAAGTA